jgi:hypothetical protein
MAYLNLLASVSESDIEVLRRDERSLIRPSLVVGVSHLLGSWIDMQPLGGLLRQALDGGELVNAELWHPYRVPCFHRPSAVQSLNQDINAAWQQVLASMDIPAEDWLGYEMRRLLRLFGHATASQECVLSVLEPPIDWERAHLVRIPWLTEPISAKSGP